MKHQRSTPMWLCVAALAGCVSLTTTKRLSAVRTLAVAPDITVAKPSFTNPYFLHGAVGLVVGEIEAQSDAKRVTRDLKSSPRTLAEVLREEFSTQVQNNGRFQIVEAAQADAVATLEITELSIGKVSVDSRERPIVTLQVTIADLAGQRLWRGRTRLNEVDIRTPQYERGQYVNDAGVAFQAFSVALKIAVYDLVKDLIRSA